MINCRKMATILNNQMIPMSLFVIEIIGHFWSICFFFLLLHFYYTKINIKWLSMWWFRCRLCEWRHLQSTMGCRRLRPPSPASMWRMYSSILLILCYLPHPWGLFLPWLKRPPLMSLLTTLPKRCFLWNRQRWNKATDVCMYICMYVCMCLFGFLFCFVWMCVLYSFW